MSQVADGSGEPSIVERKAQPYAAVAGIVSMAHIAQIADRFGEVFAFVAEQGMQPAAPPFLKYDVFHPDGRLEIEAGVPVALQGKDSGEFFFAALPAGRYATLIHTGPYDGLMGATEQLLQWVGGRGQTFDVHVLDDGSERWASRVEFYPTDPREEPDQSKWVAHLAFRLAD